MLGKTAHIEEEAYPEIAMKHSPRPNALKYTMPIYPP